MQLTKPDSVRKALTLATCTLLTGVQAARADKGWEVDSALLYYTEQDRVSAAEPVVNMKKRLSEDESIGVKLVIDSLTGASPSGAVPTTTPQTYTSPSGDRTYTTPANEIPLDPTFLDTRTALSFEWKRPFFGTERSIVYSGHGSKEYDYASIGLGATLSQDFNQRNTTLTGGLSFNADQVDPVGGVPVGLTPQPAFPAVKATTGQQEDKTVVDALVGITQVLNRETLVQANFSFGRDTGYITDPYKLISEVDATTGAPVNTRYEKRPEDRTRQSLYFRTLRSLGLNTLDASYRYYWDDWGVNAHTIDVHLRFEMGRDSYIEPQFRYSAQTQGADFYRPFLLQGETVSNASADYRLSEMTTTTVGVKYGTLIRHDGEFSLRLGYMLQTGDVNAANVPGQLATQELFPENNALLFQVGYSFRR